MLDQIAYELVYIFAKFRALLIVILVLLLTMLTALAEPLSGASYIGICSPHFPCKQALNALPEGPKSIGYLAGTFGWKCPCVEDAIGKFGNSLYIRVHISNATCFPSRGRVCQKGELFYGMSQREAERKILARDKKLLGRFRAYVRLVQRQTAGAGVVRYSPCLECGLQNAARRVLHVQMKRVLGSSAEPFVDNPYGHPCLEGTICEHHGDRYNFPQGQMCIADNDGTPIDDRNIGRFLSTTEQCEARFLWFRGFNLLPPSGFVPPRRRTWKPSQWQFDSLREYLER